MGQLTLYYDHKTGSGYSSGADDGYGSAIFTGGYADGSDRPLYYFGHGLSYTTLELTDFSIAEQEVPIDGVIQARCTITNTGRVAGDQVIQLYYRFHGAHVTWPNQQLVGLQPGQRKEIRFELNTARLGYYNEEMDFVVEPGPGALADFGSHMMDICDYLLRDTCGEICEIQCMQDTCISMREVIGKPGKRGSVTNDDVACWNCRTPPRGQADGAEFL